MQNYDDIKEHIWDIQQKKLLWEKQIENICNKVSEILE